MELLPGCIVYHKLEQRYVFIVGSSPLRGIVYDADKTLPQNNPIEIHFNHLLCDEEKKVIQFPASVQIPDQERERVARQLKCNAE